MGEIEAFLREHSDFTVENRGGWLLASRREGDGLPWIAFRADMDALPWRDGARHGCGHDGHSAILCALALRLTGRPAGVNLHLIFQGAEETGEGARAVCESWPGLQRVSRIYGLHNIPGFPMGTLLIREGCFACASEGLIVDVAGRPAHAAYPDTGANPASLLCGLTLEVPRMIGKILQGGDRLLMSTVVGLNLGGEDFGMSASHGRLCLTLRGHRQADIETLKARIQEYARAGCEAGGMVCRFETRDPFPDTTNPPEVVREAAALWRRAGLPVQTLAEPMRWSEDFGWYLKRVPGMYFGVGLGENRPALHTADYAFDDAILSLASEALERLIKK